MGDTYYKLADEVDFEQLWRTAPEMMKVFDDAYSATEARPLPIISPNKTGLLLQNISQGCLWSLIACETGRLDVLKWLREQNFILAYDNEELFYSASASGNLDCLKYLHENGSEDVINEMKDSGTCVWRACEGGYPSPDVLRYLHENGHSLSKSKSCFRGILTYRKTKQYPLEKRIDCFEYLVEKGCPLDEDIFNGFSVMGPLPDHLFERELGVSKPEIDTELEACWIIALRKGCPYDRRLLQNTSVNFLKRIFQDNLAGDIKFDALHFSEAVAEGDTEKLIYLRSQDCSVDKKQAYSALLHYIFYMYDSCNGEPIPFRLEPLLLSYVKLLESWGVISNSPECTDEGIVDMFKNTHLFGDTFPPHEGDTADSFVIFEKNGGFDFLNENLPFWNPGENITRYFLNREVCNLNAFKYWAESDFSYDINDLISVRDNYSDNFLKAMDTYMAFTGEMFEEWLEEFLEGEEYEMYFSRNTNLIGNLKIVMSEIDECKTLIPEGNYLTIMKELKSLYDRMKEN